MFNRFCVRRGQLAALGAVILFGTGLVGAAVVDFDDLALSANSHWSGSTSSSGFHSGNASFNTFYESTYGSWAGFAYSNVQDAVTSGWPGEFNAIPGVAHSGSNYAIAYRDTYNQVMPAMTLDTPTVLDSLYVTNTNWAWYFVKNGDSYFGQNPYGAGDWLLLTITGRSVTGAPTGSLPVYLADYTNGHTTALNTWTRVDLVSLGQVAALEFDVTSNRAFTPLYCAVDSISVPEPVSLLLLGLGTMLCAKRRS
jgi:hypothetical protein